MKYLTLQMAAFLFFGLTATMRAQISAHAPLTVESASIDKDGLVHIKWSGQPEQIMPPDRDAYCSGTEHCVAVGADALSISANRRSVGWTADYDADFQSDPIPMTLMIARNGRIAHTIHAPRPIYGWQFEEGDARIAVFSDTPHGNMIPICELYDTHTWKRIAEWHRGKSTVLPEWAKPFADDVGDTQLSK